MRFAILFNSFHEGLVALKKDLFPNSEEAHQELAVIHGLGARIGSNLSSQYSVAEVELVAPDTLRTVPDGQLVSLVESTSKPS